MHVVGAPDCPKPNCEDDSGNEAYVFLVENGCSGICNTNTACSERFLTLHSVHDSCPHDTLSTTSEEGLHDFEDQCEILCNAPGSSAEKDQLICLSRKGGVSGAAAGRSGKSLVVAMLSVSFYFLLA
jgi:hypothetical protein